MLIIFSFCMIQWWRFESTRKTSSKEFMTAFFSSRLTENKVSYRWLKVATYHIRYMESSARAAALRAHYFTLIWQFVRVWAARNNVLIYCTIRNNLKFIFLIALMAHIDIWLSMHKPNSSPTVCAPPHLGFLLATVNSVDHWVNVQMQQLKWTHRSEFTRVEIKWKKLQQFPCWTRSRAHMETREKITSN